ncbi:MAG: C4-dicarboxylate ABC transporter, partial [Selenomonas sp.]|nr:C4-dicarboxylate ABC transporter [Selenomonas sp.]
MLAMALALITTVIVAYMILHKKNAQTVLFAGGIFLMAMTILLGYPLLEGKKSTGMVWFDIFKFIEDTFSSRAAGIGLLIMAVGGFAKYMEHIGASRVLVYLSAKPLSMMKSPY